jgi:hypothetical protein
MIGRQFMMGLKISIPLSKIITLVSLTPKQVYDDQIKLKGEHETMKRENQGEEHREKRPSNSIKP